MPNTRLQFIRWGDMAALALELGVSRQAVYQVFAGKSKSERISKALIKMNEKRRMQALKLALDEIPTK